MTSRQSILALISLSLICLLVGCGSSSYSGNNTQPISVALSTTPTSLAIHATQAVTATVTYDTKSAGVTWSVTCGSAGACGSFSATTSPSGTSVTYTAPSAVPTGNTVTITATSVTDATKTASATITIAAITVTLSPTLKSIAPSLSTAEVATVNGDPANAGVNWSCTPASACGSFSPTQTASGNTSTFTAPSVTGNVVVTATSVTDTSATASATITVTSAAAQTLAQGNYVFSLSGIDGTSSLYFVAGVFTVSGTGVISGGEQDYRNFSNLFSDAITGGSYSFNSDGNLQITLNTNDPAIGPGGNTNTGTGTEVLDATLVSGTRGLISEFDTWATSSGTLDLQTSASLSLPASYAFTIAGADSSISPVAIGGVLSIDGSNNISGVFDINDVGALGSAETFDPSILTPPDTAGRATFTLNPNASLGLGTITLIGYVVDGTQIRTVEAIDGFGGTTGGNALAQTGAGSFTASSISGFNYVFATPGFEAAGGAVQVAGLLTANSGGTLSGTVNFNDIATQSPQGGTAFTGGTYTVDSTGRVTMSGITDNSTFGYNLQLYLTGDGHALAISMDSGADVLAGFAFQQAGGPFTAPSFAGTYATNVSQITSGGNTFAGVGLLAADGVGTLSGFIDLNEQNLPVPALPVTGTFTPNSNGIFTGTVTGLYTPSVTTPANFTYYVIDPGHVVAIETDNLEETLGYLELQH